MAAAAKSIYANGADLVFKNGQQVLGVELKNLSSDSVNLGTLGKNAADNYGGSIDRIVNSATRFYNSSNEQLQQESQAVKDAYDSGNLQNALYTNAGNVSDDAQKLFNGVYTDAENNTATALKPLVPALSQTKNILNTLENLGGNIDVIPFIMPINPHHPFPRFPGDEQTTSYNYRSGIIE